VVAAEWQRCRDWLVPVMVDTTEAEVLALLAANQAQLWAAERAAMVLQLLKPPPTLHIWLAGGEMTDLLDMRGGMEAWARSQGCEFVTINGRRGWARVLKPYGYVPDAEEVRKAL
jgi:hypothetical protein